MEIERLISRGAVIEIGRDDQIVTLLDIRDAVD
jgi:hypothetical protein